MVLEYTLPLHGGTFLFPSQGSSSNNVLFQAVKLNKEDDHFHNAHPCRQENSCNIHYTLLHQSPFHILASFHPSHFSISIKQELLAIPGAFLDIILEGVNKLIQPPLSGLPGLPGSKGSYIPDDS